MFQKHRQKRQYTTAETHVWGWKFWSLYRSLWSLNKKRSLKTSVFKKYWFTISQRDQTFSIRVRRQSLTVFFVVVSNTWLWHVECFVRTGSAMCIWISHEQTGLGVYLMDSRVRKDPFVYESDVRFERIVDESDTLSVGRYRGWWLGWGSVRFSYPRVTARIPRRGGRELIIIMFSCCGVHRSSNHVSR